MIFLSVKKKLTKDFYLKQKNEQKENSATTTNKKKTLKTLLDLKCS